jgi:hypothetical protein
MTVTQLPTLHDLRPGRALLEQQLLLDAARRLYSRQVIVAAADARAELPAPHGRRLEGDTRERARA